MLDLTRREYLQALAKGSMLATLAATVPSAFVRAATGTVYDVAVYGATAAGVMAAVAAARQGANVVIITGTTQWGGMVSQGLGSTDIGNAEVIGGLARSLFGSIAEYYYNNGYSKFYTETNAPLTSSSPYIDGATKNIPDTYADMKQSVSGGCSLSPGYQFEPHVAENAFAELIQCYSNISIVHFVTLNLTTPTSGVTKSGTKITAINLSDGTSIQAKTFIDCSYEGDLMAQAGVWYVTGREAASAAAGGGPLNYNVPSGSSNMTTYNEPSAGFGGGQFTINQTTGDPANYSFVPNITLNGTLVYVSRTNGVYSATNNSNLLIGVTPYSGQAVGEGDSALMSYCFRPCLTDRPNDAGATYMVPFAGAGATGCLQKPAGYSPSNYLLQLVLTPGTADGAYSVTDPKTGVTTLVGACYNEPNYKFDQNADYFGGSWLSNGWSPANPYYPTASLTERETAWQNHFNFQTGLYYFLANDAATTFSNLIAANSAWAKALNLTGANGGRNVLSHLIGTGTASNPEANTVVWQYQQLGLAADEFTTNSPANWPAQLYVREARRMVGQYVMTQFNMLDPDFNNTSTSSVLTHSDHVGMGGYQFDCHYTQALEIPKGTIIPGLSTSSTLYTAIQNTGGILLEGGIDEGLYPTKPFEIPYGALLPLSTQVTNLIVPVCLSASHVAYCALRLEPQYMICGEAAGCAAALAVQQNAGVVGAVNIVTLINTLKSYNVILDAIDYGWTTPQPSSCISTSG